MDVSDYLNRLIPHRLDALAIAELMLKFQLSWEEPKQMQIMVDGQLQFDGLTSMFTNPILEVGILNVRGLMEFVGLKAVGTALLPLNPRNRRDDDVGIEMFSTPSGPLPLVTPEDVGAENPQDPLAAKAAVALTIDAANKRLAHFTEAYLSSPVAARHVQLACEVTQRIFERHFYLPLGSRRPAAPIESRRRDG